MIAEFFDIFGSLGFIVLIILGVFILISKKRIPKWISWIIILIGILGFIVDATIVIKTFILK